MLRHVSVISAERLSEELTAALRGEDESGCGVCIGDSEGRHADSGDGPLVCDEAAAGSNYYIGSEHGDVEVPAVAVHGMGNDEGMQPEDGCDGDDDIVQVFCAMVLGGTSHGVCDTTPGTDGDAYTEAVMEDIGLGFEGSGCDGSEESQLDGWWGSSPKHGRGGLPPVPTPQGTMTLARSCASADVAAGAPRGESGPLACSGDEVLACSCDDMAGSMSSGKVALCGKAVATTVANVGIETLRNTAMAATLTKEFADRGGSAEVFVHEKKEKSLEISESVAAPATESLLATEKVARGDHQLAAEVVELGTVLSGLAAAVTGGSSHGVCDTTGDDFEVLELVPPKVPDKKVKGKWCDIADDLADEHLEAWIEAPAGQGGKKLRKLRKKLRRRLAGDKGVSDAVGYHEASIVESDLDAIAEARKPHGRSLMSESSRLYREAEGLLQAGSVEAADVLVQHDVLVQQAGLLMGEMRALIMENMEKRAAGFPAKE
jgi:hypothetical protein